MAKRNIRRMAAEVRAMSGDLRAELDAHPDDVIAHLDRDIPPAPPSAPPGALSAKAQALQAWIAMASDTVEVREADLDALIELGAEVSNGAGSTYLSYTLWEYDDRGACTYKSLASCWVTAAGPSIDYEELKRRHAASASVESPLDVASIAADAEAEGRTEDAERIRASITVAA